MSSTTTMTKDTLSRISASPYSAKTYQPLNSNVDPAIEKQALNKSFLHNLIRDHFSLATLLSLGALAQTILFLALKPSYAALPVLVYTIYTIGHLIHAKFSPTPINPHQIYHRTTALVPSPTTGELRSGTAGEKVAVLHLAFKNYHPLGMLAPGYAKILQMAPAMIADLETSSGRAQYGFLGSDSYFQAASASAAGNTTLSSPGSGNTLMLVMYFRSLEGVHAYAASEAHHRAWKWYSDFTKGGDGAPRGTHLGIMHEVFEADAGKWECVHLNMERTGLAKGSGLVEQDGSLVGMLVDARRGVLASAKGRIS